MVGCKGKEVWWLLTDQCWTGTDRIEKAMVVGWWGGGPCGREQSTATRPGNNNHLRFLDIQDVYVYR